MHTFLAIGDAHVKPVEHSVDFEKLAVPPDVDGVFVTGDVVHRIGPDDLDVGNEFFRRLDDAGVPVVCVPGNHDPVEHYDRMTAGCSNSTVVHERRVRWSTLVDETAGDGSAAASGNDFAIAGWGCEAFDFQPEFRYLDHDALDPRPDATPSTIDYHADRVADRIQRALGEYVRGDVDVTAAADRLDVRPTEAVREEFDRVERRYDALTEVIGGDEPTVVLTHVPPFNTTVDRKDSVGDRPDDGLHWGSIPLKLAIEEHDPVAVCCGHAHNGLYDATDGGTHVLNLGFRDVWTLSIGAEERAFGYERLTGD